MFCMSNAIKYCHKDNIPLIEGYAEAIASSEKYVLHHRAEIQEDGTVRSRRWLLEHHVYYGCKPDELVFLTDAEHRKLHSRTYMSHEAYAETRECAWNKMTETKRLDGGRQSKISKEMWKKHRDLLVNAMRAGHKNSTYKKLYGLSRNELSKKLGKTEWAIQELHRKGELYGLICAV